MNSSKLVSARSFVCMLSLRLALALLLCASALTAFAQISPAPLTPIIGVLPDVDVPNRARTIVISGQHLFGCPFMQPTFDGQASLLLRGVVIRLDPVPTLANATFTSNISRIPL